MRIAVLIPLLGSVASALRLIESSSLIECQSNSSFSASLFNIVFTPHNNTLAVNVVGDSSIAGDVALRIRAAAYGYVFLKETINPCTMGLDSLCPLSAIQIAFDTNYNNISANVIKRIPEIAYGVPDLDATVTVYMYTKDNPTVDLACVRTQLANGKTVHKAGVGWATAAVAGVGLLASALVSGFGHSNTASHLALYALSLFNYFQAVAIIGLCAVPLPPMVQSWTQDFVWSMGVIRIGFLQQLATWYLIATGGDPTRVLATLGTKSVQVLKRGIEPAGHLLDRRAKNTVPDGEYVVRGIKRVAFRANMESTNLFLTGLIFYCIFVIFTLIGVTIFKGLCELAVRSRWMKNDRFQSIRHNYRITLKGIIFRLILIGYPGMSILCLWEFTQVDSAAEVVLAVIFFFGMTAALLLAALKVIQVARRSERLYKTPAYILYSDATTLHKWGFLYIQYRATAYYYILPTFAYILVKAAFVAFSQGNGTVQAIALLIIEAAALISASVLRPWMDKPSNAINISICAINLFNAILLLIFTDIFNGPGLLIGVTGVVFFIVNALFALVLLFVVLIAATFSFLRKNPDRRYHAVADNRASFIKSQTMLSTELDALAFTARGANNMNNDYKTNSLLDEGDSDRQSPDLKDREHDTAPFNNAYREPPPLSR